MLPTLDLRCPLVFPWSASCSIFVELQCEACRDAGQRTSPIAITQNTWIVQQLLLHIPWSSTWSCVAVAEESIGGCYIGEMNNLCKFRSPLSLLMMLCSSGFHRAAPVNVLAATGTYKSSNCLSTSLLPHTIAKQAHVTCTSHPVILCFVKCVGFHLDAFCAHLDLLYSLMVHLAHM